MKLEEIAAALALESIVPGTRDTAITGAYISDLLSDVMANARAGSLWITIQTHQNIVAVAALLNLAGIIIAGGHRPDAETAAKAEREGVPIFSSPETGYSVAGRLYEMGVRC